MTFLAASFRRAAKYALLLSLGLCAPCRDAIAQRALPDDLLAWGYVYNFGGNRWYSYGVYFDEHVNGCYWVRIWGSGAPNVAYGADQFQPIGASPTAVPYGIYGAGYDEDIEMDGVPWRFHSYIRHDVQPDAFFTLVGGSDNLDLWTPRETGQLALNLNTLNWRVRPPEADRLPPTNGTDPLIDASVWGLIRQMYLVDGPDHYLWHPSITPAPLWFCPVWWRTPRPTIPCPPAFGLQTTGAGPADATEVDDDLPPEPEETVPPRQPPPEEEDVPPPPVTETPVDNSPPAIAERVFVLKEGYPIISKDADRNASYDNGRGRSHEASSTASSAVLHWRTLHGGTGAVTSDWLMNFSLGGAIPDTLRLGDTITLSLSGTARGAKMDGYVSASLCLNASGFSVEHDTPYRGPHTCHVTVGQGVPQAMRTCTLTVDPNARSLSLRVAASNGGGCNANLCEYEWELRE